MHRFLEWLDGLAGIRERRGFGLWLGRAAFLFLILMVLAAPHSIAATQTAWIAGMLLWLLGIGIERVGGGKSGKSGQGTHRAGRSLEIALWAFFLWSVVTSLASYEPAISIDKLRGAAVFLIFFFVVVNLRNLKAVYFLAFALIVSCMVNVLWMPVQRLIGRGVEIHGMAPDGPLAKAYLHEGDTLLTANGRKVSNPEQVVAAVEQNDLTRVKFYRPDFEYTVEVKRNDLLPGATALERLGIAGWSKSHNWRSAGFYGHYTTYAEVLQLIASLVFGLLAAALLATRRLRLIPEPPRLPVAASLLLFSLAAMCLALLLTVTRGAQLGFLVSAFVIVAAIGSRKLLVGAVIIALPIAIVGLIFLQQSRNVGFLDPKDESTRYRQTMWRDGMRLWTESPRHLVFGVGMDSIKEHWREWQMFDGGRLSMGHFHSTPVQLLVERGFPALVFWMAVLMIYAFLLLRSLKLQPRPLASNPKSQIRNPKSNMHAWIGPGILLGCLGGAVGFFTSGLAHYNLGDQEVAMVFYLLMSIGVASATRFSAD